MLNDLCRECGVVMTVDWRKDYFTRRTKELIYCSLKCTHNNRKSTRIRVDKQEKITNCQRCNNFILEDWRANDPNNKYNLLKWCSRKCANTRTLSDSSKQQIKQSLISFYKEHPKSSSKKLTLIECSACRTQFTLKITNGKLRQFCSKTCKQSTKIHTRTCSQCGVDFLAKSVNGNYRKTCSTKCKNIVHSLRRQEYIKHHGCFATERHSFTYKGTTVNVDSKLERAAIIYMVDILKASNIERYNNLLNYIDNGVHRTFNPDFICYINNKTHIVEVKQLWKGDQSHVYAKNIPLKREALKQYCQLNNYEMLWLDFNAAPDMRDTYREVLNLGKKVKTSSIQ